MAAQPSDDNVKHLAASNVALVLAAGIALALNVLTISLLLAAWKLEQPELSANGTQLLTGWGGGLIGVLGSYIGFTFGQKSATADAASSSSAPPPRTPPPRTPPAAPRVGGQQ